MTSYERRRLAGVASIGTGALVAVEGATVALDQYQLLDEHGRSMFIEQGALFSNLASGLPMIAAGAFAIVYGTKLIKNRVR